MKIWLVHTFHHDRGGDSTYVRQLDAMLREAGHQVRHLAMRHPDNDPSVDEAGFVPWNGARRPSLQLLREAIWSPDTIEAATRMLRQERPDVVHFHHVHRHLTPSLLDPLDAQGVPVVWTAHDYELVCPAGTLFTEGKDCERCAGHRYHNAVLHRCKHRSWARSAGVALEKTIHARRRVEDRVARIICPSSFQLEAFVRMGIPRAKLTHIRNPLVVENPDLPGPALESQATHAWAYAGRLSDDKGIGALLAASELLPGSRLAIVGSGALDNEVRAFARRHAEVDVLGHLSRRHTLAVLRASQVVVVPSLWPENQPYAVLEPQALGKAVVATRVGGIPELITDGEHGTLISPNDPAAMASAVRQLLAEPDRRARLGAAARVRVLRDHSPQAHLQALLAIYRDVIALR